MLAAILVVVAALFARALAGELVYDDLLMVGRNPDLASLANVPRFFARGYWDFLGPDHTIGYWRPLTATMLALGSAIGGGAPWGLHLMSLLAHLGACAALFRLVRVLDPRPWVAGFATLLFGVHPLQVESVAWITSLSDPLFGCLAILSLGSFLRWRQRGSSGLPLGACLWLALALLAKETALAVLPAALVIDLARARASHGEAPDARANQRAYASLGALLVAYVLARTFVFRSPWAGFDIATTGFGVGAARLAWLRLELFGGALGLLAWPAELNLFRSFRPVIPPGDWTLVVAGAWTAVFLVVLAWAYRRRRAALLVALALVPAVLLPVLVRVESLGAFPLADRYLYVPVAGFSLALALGAARLPAGLATAALAVVAALWGLRSFERIAFWHDEETLFREAADATPRSPYVQRGLGRVLLERYREERTPGLLRESEEAFVRAQDLLLEARDPDTDIFAMSRDYLQVNLGYGWCQLERDRQQGYRGSNTALTVFEELARKVEEIQGRTIEARSLGIQVQDRGFELEQVYTAIGVAQMEAGHDEEAESALRHALEINARYPEAHQNLGRLYFREHEVVLARRHFERAAELRPHSFEDRLLLAQALHTEGEVARAEALARELHDSRPERAEPLLILAAVDLGRGEIARALARADEALKADPQNGQAWYLRASALRQNGAPESALSSLRRAVELAPESFEASYDLGILLINSGETQDGLASLVQAYGMCDDPDLLARMRAALEEMHQPFVEPLLQLAVIDARRRDDEQAERWLDIALTHDPDDPECLFQKGRLRRRAGRDDEALQLMRRACELLPDSFAAHCELGRYMAELQRKDEAIEYLERALEIRPPAEWPSELANQSIAGLEQELAQLR